MVNAQSVPLASRAFTITHYDVELRPQIETRTVDVHITWLRQKLETNPKVPELIVTLRGLGYKFAG